MKILKSFKVLLIIFLAIALGFLMSDKQLLAQENPEDLQICNGPEGTVEDPASEACVIRDCDCNRIANNGKVGELICMEKRTVRNDDGAVQYACKFPNSPTGASCDTIGITCPGASSNASSPTDNSTPAQTQDPYQSSTVCEEKLLQWAADKACDSQYNRYVSLDRWQSSAVDPATGQCREFFLPNHVLEDEKCGSSAGICDRAPVNLDCQTKICLSDGAEACQETWRDEDCNVTTKVGRLTGATCKSDTTRIDITSAIQAAAQGNLSNDAQEFGINITMGFRDRSTVRGAFKLKLGADQSGSTQSKTIWDVAAIWMDGTRFTLNPNNYSQNNFNLSNLNSDLLVNILTTRVSEQAYEAHPQISVEFSDGSTRLGSLDIRIEPGWVGTGGPKTIEQMINTLTQITITNPYAGDYFTVNREQMMNLIKANIPGQIPNEGIAYSIIVPVKFRDGTELTSNATLTVKQSTSSQDKIETIWDITGIEMNGWNFTLNPDNIQPNNFTFYQNPEVIGQILNLEVPTQHTEVPIAALVKFQDGTTRDAELKLVFEPGQVGANPPRTITDALSNIQSVTLRDPISFTDYYFGPEEIRNGIGRAINVSIPYGELQATLPISLTSVRGSRRSDNITLVYQPEDTSSVSGPATQTPGDKLQKSCVWKECDSVSGSMVCIDSWTNQYGEGFTKRRPISESCNASGTSTTPVIPQDTLVSAEKVCLVRGDTGDSCQALNFGKCLEKKALAGNLYIGFRFKDSGVTKYFQFESKDVNMPTVNLWDLNQLFMGMYEWNQSISLITQNQVMLPQNVSVIPITIEDRRTSPAKEFKINANFVDYKPKGCP